MESRRQMKACARVGISVLFAFLVASTLASTPQLHEKLHKPGAHHECAATLIASGNCEHSAPPSAVPRSNNFPVWPAFLPQRVQFAVASVPSLVQESARPGAH